MSPGGRKPTISDEEILLLIDEHWAPFVHSTDLTEEMDMGRTGVYKRLVKLEDKGYLESKSPGGIRNFWLTEQGVERVRELKEPDDSEESGG